MPSFKLRVSAEALRSGSILDGAYHNLGTAFDNPIRIVKITNPSSADCTISYDGGTTDNEIVPAGSYLLLDLNANKDTNCDYVFPVGTQFAYKGSGAGTIYLSAYYVR